MQENLGTIVRPKLQRECLQLSLHAVCKISAVYRLRKRRNRDIYFGRCPTANTTTEQEGLLCYGLLCTPSFSRVGKSTHLQSRRRLRRRMLIGGCCLRNDETGLSVYRFLFSFRSFLLVNLRFVHFVMVFSMIRTLSAK